MILAFDVAVGSIAKFVEGIIRRETWKHLSRLKGEQYADEHTAIEAVLDLLWMNMESDRFQNDLGERVDGVTALAFAHQGLRSHSGTTVNALCNGNTWRDIIKGAKYSEKR